MLSALPASPQNQPGRSNQPGRKDQPIQPNGRHVVGIDIGLRTHAAAGITAQGADFHRQVSFTNDRAGVDRLESQLLRPLGPPAQLLIGMEATGHYWMPLFFELKRRGYDVIAINPIQTRGKFRTRIRKTKTDKLDARAIARLVLYGEAHASRIPSEQTFALRLSTRHRWRLTDLRGDLERFALTLMDQLFPEFHHHFDSPLNATGRALLRKLGLVPRLLGQDPAEVTALITQASRKKVGPASITELLDKARASIGTQRGEAVLVAQLRDTLTLIEQFEAQTAALDQAFAEHPVVKASPLQSLGLGSTLIATIHAETDPIADFSLPAQFVAFAGLDPSVYDSGQMHGTRTAISKRGSPHLRRALYLAAFTLYRKHKPFQRLYQLQRKKGRHHTDALIIVAHKLARIIWRLLTDNRPFRSRPPQPRQK